MLAIGKLIKGIVPGVLPGNALPGNALKNVDRG